MARFFSLDEIRAGHITTAEDITMLVEKIRQLKPFEDGEAVIFGSVAWGAHRWRSDIDIAYNKRSYYSSHTPGKYEVAEVFRQHYGYEHGGVLALRMVEWLGTERREDPHAAFGSYTLHQLSPSTRDHFRLLAKTLGEPYHTFFRSIDMVSRPRDRDIQFYLERIEDLWGPSKNFQAFPAIENFPKQLMRKVLGKLKQLPCPDTVPNIRASFWQLEEPWARVLLPLFEPFFQIDERYQELVAGVASGNITCKDEREYEQHVAHLFNGLPVQRICEIVREEVIKPKPRRRYAIRLWSTRRPKK